MSKHNSVQRDVNFTSCHYFLQENLRLEQKTVMQMQFLVMLRLLSPLQSALFLVEAYPARPDALALSNICAQV